MLAKGSHCPCPSSHRRYQLVIKRRQQNTCDHANHILLRLRIRGFSILEGKGREQSDIVNNKGCGYY